MSWRYGIVKKWVSYVRDSKPAGMFEYTIREIYEEPIGYTKDFIYPVAYLDPEDNMRDTEAKCIDSIKSQLIMMRNDCRFPVIEEK